MLFQLEKLLIKPHIYNYQKKVEEDRWIRSTEHEAYLKRKAAASVVHPVMTAEELAAKELHATTVDEAFGILSKTGCKVEDVTVEALAAWKLGE